MATTSGTDLVAPVDEAAILADWGRRHLRDLPWRNTRDPWAVLVSEVMAQQTQVDRVVPKWRAFLDRWPDPAQCAEAALGEILDLWSGLGYPRRARDLHATAGLIVSRHGGAVPDELASLLALPGIGRYTARAVMAFAFEADVAVVDTNIARVLARRAGKRLTTKEVWAVAEARVPTGGGWIWNQSLMGLGAQCCRPRHPNCSACPLQTGCAWAEAGNPPPDPAVGSALVSGRQTRFAGSDRQARGRLMEAMRSGPVPQSDLATASGLGDDPERAERLGAALVAEGLAVADPSGALIRP